VPTAAGIAGSAAIIVPAGAGLTPPAAVTATPAGAATMTRRAGARACAALLALGLAPSPAASRGDAMSRRDGVGWIEARQLVELFGESCLRFATPAGLRGWLEGQGYRRMPEPQERALLRGPGRGYDASTRTGHLALLSRDDGWCIAVADSVDAPRLSSLLEQRLRLAGLSFQTVGESGGDDAAPDHRYSVQHGRHQSLLVVEVARLEDRLQASLLLAPME
jgi:hypothetical protein